MSNFAAWWKHNGPESGLDGSWRIKDLVERAWNHGYSQCYRDRVTDPATSEANAALERAALACEAMLTGHGARKGGSDAADSARRACAVHIRMLIRTPNAESGERLPE